jgi:hypothetical protein
LFSGSATVNKSITEHDAPNVNDLHYQIFGTLACVVFNHQPTVPSFMHRGKKKRYKGANEVEKIPNRKLSRLPFLMYS